MYMMVKTTTRQKVVVMSRLNLVSTAEICRLLGCDQRTLRRHETPDGRWCTIFGMRFRVYRYGNAQHDQRRYDLEEVRREIERARQ